MTAMEDILDLYARPETPGQPIVCVDETSKQHLREMRSPLAVKPGTPYRYDPEYKRNGVSNLFMIFAPLLGFRHVEVTDTRTSVDFAHIGFRDIVDVHFPNAEKILLVCDNLNTHKLGSFLRCQCLSRRIPDQETLKREVQAWQTSRNEQRAKVNWRFRTDDARIKIKKLYPSF